MQTHEEFLRSRKKYIGASDAPAIMGASPWVKALDIYKDKISEEISVFENRHTKRGKELEKKALETFEDLTGYIMREKRVYHPTIGYMMASLDGMEISGKAIVEIKCPEEGGKSHEMALDGEVPSYYIPQLMHQMEVCGLKKAYYFSYTLTSYKLLEVHFDEKYVENLLKEEAEFWNCVLTKTEPKSKKNYIHMDSKEWTDAANNYRDITRQLKDLEARKQTLKDSLFAMANGVPSEGSSVTLSKITRKGQMDYEAFIAHPKVKALIDSKEVNIEEFRKSSKEEWRIT